MSLHSGTQTGHKLTRFKTFLRQRSRSEGVLQCEIKQPLLCWTNFPTHCLHLYLAISSSFPSNRLTAVFHYFPQKSYLGFSSDSPTVCPLCINLGKLLGIITGPLGPNSFVHSGTDKYVCQIQCVIMLISFSIPMYKNIQIRLLECFWLSTYFGALSIKNH